MTPTNDDTRSIELSQADFQALLHEKVRQAVRFTLITVRTQKWKPSCRQHLTNGLPSVGIPATGSTRGI